MDDDLFFLLHQIIYLMFSGIMVLVFVTLTLLRDPIYDESRFSPARRRCHLIGILCSVLLVVRSVDPDGANNIWTGGQIYIITDNITNLLLVAFNVAAYQVYHILFENLEPSSMTSAGSSSRRVKIILVSVVFLIVASVNTLDAIVIYRDVYWYRGLVMYVYVISFVMVIILAELTGRNLRDLFSALFPETSSTTSFYGGVMVAKARLLMADNAQKEGRKMVSALQDILGPENSTSTASGPPAQRSGNSSHKHKKHKHRSHRHTSNPLAGYSKFSYPDSMNANSTYRREVTSAKIDQMITRWIIVQRFAQLFCICIMGILLWYGSKAITESHESAVPQGGAPYRPIEDSQVWLQCLALLLVLYFSWIPLSCSCIYSLHRHHGQHQRLMGGHDYKAYRSHPSGPQQGRAGEGTMDQPVGESSDEDDDTPPGPNGVDLPSATGSPDYAPPEENSV